MIRVCFFLLLSLAVAHAADDPRRVAEEALAAWHAADGKRLDAVAHPELKRRCRDARILRFYAEGKEDQQRILTSGSDTEVIALLCDALRAIVPGPEKVEHTDQFLSTARKGDLMIVTFESISKPAGSRSSGTSMKTHVVLKRNGDEWRFLWSPAVQLHVDLTWDPTQ